MDSLLVKVVWGLLACVALSSCGSEQNRVPLGTWKDTRLPRYMTIEPNLQLPAHYTVTLFNQSALSYELSHELPQKRQVSANINDGVLTLKTAEADIPVLYHPSGNLIMINGQSTFRRVTLSNESIPLRDHHSSMERSPVH